MPHTIFITGGNRGIGKEIARQMAAHQWRVFIGVRDLQSGEIVAKSIDGEVEAIQLDVTKAASVEIAAETFGARNDHLDVLVNNAGLYPDDDGDTILRPDQQRMRAAWETNVYGPAAVTSAFLPWLKRAPHGRVIHVSSGYGQMDGMSPDVPAYCLSKWTLNGLTLMQTQPLKAVGITVNAMCPGWVRTDMGGPNASRSVSEGADTAVWLATEAPHSVTGKLFRDRQEIPW